MAPTHLTIAEKKRNGAFYTPPEVVDRVWRIAWPNVKTSRPRVLDPACGNGAFLARSLRPVAAVGGRDAVLRYVETGLHGRDTDPIAVSGCRKRILWYADEVAGLTAGERTRLTRALERHIRCQDTLTVEDAGLYDLVIGNPPFVSADNIPPERKVLLKSLYPHTAIHRFDLACLFFEHALAHLRPDGLLAMLLPARALTGHYFQPLRTMLLERARLLAVADLGQSALKVNNPVGLIVAQTGRPAIQYTLDDVSVEERERKIGIELFQNAPQKKFNLSPLAGLTTALRERFPPLRKDYLVTDGVQTGPHLKRVLVREPEQTEDYTPALRRGSNIPGRYAPPQWDGWWMLKPHLCPSAPGFHYGARRTAVFATRPKIILRQTAPEIIATWDAEGFASANSIFHVVSRSNNTGALLYLLAVLNSVFVSKLYQAETHTGETSFPQLYITELNALPVPDYVETGEPKALTKLALQALEYPDSQTLKQIEKRVEALYR